MAKQKSAAIEGSGEKQEPDQLDRRLPVGSAAAAAHVGTTERHIRTLIYTRQIPYLKLGGKVLFDLDELDRYMLACRRDVVQ